MPIGPGTGPVPGLDGVPLPPDVTVDLLDAHVEVVASGYAIPWAVAVLGEDEYLVTERFGALSHIRDGQRTDLEGLPETYIVQAGPLFLGGYNDVSLHPQFETNGLVYLAFVQPLTEDQGAGHMAVGRFNFSDRTVQGFEIIFQTNSFSVGSRIVWQDDAHFFVTQGAAGSPFPEPGAQDLDSDSGKIHRLRADGSIPSDNPVFDGKSGPTSIWSYGHRDTQGLFYSNGTLYANEHGPLGGDELNVIEKGGNYGWPLFSYGLNYDGSPVGELTEAEAEQMSLLPLKGWGPEFNMAPSGLMQLQDSAFPERDGVFLWGALAQRRLMGYDPASGRTTILLEQVGRVRDVAQLPSGNLLILYDTTNLAPDEVNGSVAKLIKQ
ncbi:MAG: PQQ-dependent sugar dehydrogenase [Bacteroidota bacterium]